MKGVYFIGATNRPDLLDSGLMRKGRLDLKIYLPVNKDAANRLKVLTTCCRKVALSNDVNLSKIAGMLPNITTGADISSLISQAHGLALKRKIDNLLREYYLRHHHEERDPETISVDDITTDFKEYVNGKTDQELGVTIDQQDLLDVCSSFKPSINEQDLEFYDELGRKYSDL
jgi:SpoVK/Ycf46/Vps4 family AAA+-type ATPase